MTSTRKFKAKVSESGSSVFIPIPFDPNEVWGAKQRHYVAGTINGCAIRGPLSSDGQSFFLPLGAAWRRGAKIGTDEQVTVTISPEGPQQGNLAPDVAAALAAEPNALTFFESLATFYRNTYIKWIESAKRPETRAARIAEMMSLLKAGKKQK
ncbi:MAG: YdeI/OmpD-associated family protein [Chloroflexi bacterium]|nr:YdeI/OmpD-associated family protein [Chloroflexota bacterium]